MAAPVRGDRLSGPGPRAVPVTRRGDAIEAEADALARRPESGRSRTSSGGSAGSRSRVEPGVVPARGGDALDPAVRATMETHFGHDFSRVRVHTGAEASHLTARMQARAYSVGHDIMLGGGETAHNRASMLLHHELAHVVQHDRTGRLVVARHDHADPGPAPVTATPAAPQGSPGSNFTPEEAGLLQQARVALKPQGSAIVGVLIPEGGHPINLVSGGGQGFSSHIEGKATAIMRERSIARAKLLVELEPCQICDRSTYPGPDVPKEGIVGTFSGRSIPMQTSKINTALPRGTKLTLVGPESTGHYEGVGPKIAPPVSPPAAAASEPVAAPKPAVPAPPQATAKPAATPEPPVVKPPVAPEAPFVTPGVTPQAPWKAGLKAGGKAAAWIILFAALDYLLWSSLQEQVEQEMDKVRRNTESWARREKAKNPDQPVHITWTVRLDNYQRFIPLLGWTPDLRRLMLAGFSIGTSHLDAPTVEVQATHGLFYDGETRTTRFSELLIP